MPINEDMIASGLIGSQAGFAGLGAPAGVRNDLLHQAQRARNAELSSWAEQAQRAWDPPGAKKSEPLTLQEELQKETNEWLKGI